MIRGAAVRSERALRGGIVPTHLPGVYFRGG